MKMYKLTGIIVSVLILIGGFETSAQDKHWLSYEPAIVELEGRVIVESKYGPPNFGENPKTDVTVRVPVLVLTKRVNVHGNPEAFPFNVEVKGIRRVQLIVFNLKGSYKEFIGKKVRVKGTLFHAHTGGHYTDVVMDVRSIEQLPERR